MSVNEIEPVSLAVKIVGVARLKFFFQIEGRLRVICACHRHYRLEWTIDLGVSRGKQLYLMSPLG